MKHVVKRGGHTEEFDPRKLYASIYSIALAMREPVGTTELIANEVTKAVEKWLENKHEVTSNDIRRQAAKHLEVINEDTAHLYMHHRVLW